jgi:hypothetical protein
MEYRMAKDYSRTLKPVKAKIDPANVGRDGSKPLNSAKTA